MRLKRWPGKRTELVEQGEAGSEPGVVQRELRHLMVLGIVVEERKAFGARCLVELLLEIIDRVMRVGVNRVLDEAEHGWYVGGCLVAVWLSGPSIFFLEVSKNL